MAGTLELFDLPTDVLLGLAEPLLQAAEEFVFLAFGKGEVVIGKLAVLLLQLPFDLVPISFELHRCHTDN